ncbi:MAG: alpha/beta hydrolase [Polyangiales bacterium]
MPRVSVEDGSVSYEVYGDGPWVLFVQGVGLGGRAWTPQVRELSRDHRCVVFDNRGIGGSHGSTRRLSVDMMARDALAVLDALGIEQTHLVGHSLGGVIVQRMALSAPKRCASLAFLCTFAGGQDLGSPSARLMWLGMRSRLGTREMRRRAFARLVMPESYLERCGDDRVIGELEEVFGHPLWQSSPLADRQLRALRAYDDRGELPKLAALRCLVLSGRLDPIATHQANVTLAQAIGAKHKVWEDASHALPIQHATEVNAALRDHFAR